MYITFKANKKILGKLMLLVLSLSLIIAFVAILNHTATPTYCTQKIIDEATFLLTKSTNSDQSINGNPSDPAQQVTEPDNNPPYKKTVYLTFDDGPSDVTLDVLKVLKAYNIKATFFVIAADNNQDKLPYIQNILNDGHYIGLHSCTHSYKKIYNNTENFWKDISELKNKLSPYLKDVAPMCIRFPGGSTNTVSKKYGGSDIMQTLIAQATQKGYKYVDWNSCAEDATGTNPSPERIAQNILKSCKNNDTVVVLMHDTKNNKNTAEALPTVIEWLLENDFVFDTVDHLDKQI